MDTISRDKAIKILHKKRVLFFDIADAKKIFGIEKENTLYKLLQRLERSEVIKRIVKGKYIFAFEEAGNFELANFLVDPSYISLESALSFYGILSQFPYTITSVTSLKSKKVIYEEKEYQFAHLERKYFSGFIKKNNFLIATPEKALLDELYFMAKKIRSVHFEDLDLKIIDKRKFKRLSKEYRFLPLQNLIKELKLC